MGTAGNRDGYKEFCFNTTIRNPKRNRDFLLVFMPFNGCVFNKATKLKYYSELVKYGVYKLSNVPKSIKEKWEKGIELDNDEIEKAIKDNPQECGHVGRVMTQLRALKDQGFVRFEKPSGNSRIFLTQLGMDLINNIKDPMLIYTKAMLGTHAKSIIRDTMLNESRPFLNTLFVIKEVNERWEKLSSANKGKGILFHEFGAFVLTMKDCNYKKCAERIIDYRKRNRFEINCSDIREYFRKEGFLNLGNRSIVNDYPDEVMRKFEMTGLVVRRGSHNYRYVDFSVYNRAKVDSILEQYKDYQFEQFTKAEDYYDYLYNQEIPWENNDILRKRIVDEKSKVLKIQLDDSLTIEEKEEFLDRQFYTKALEKAINANSFSFICKELLILAKHCKEKSKLEDISEPLRLEYLLALFFGKKYGLKGLISNILYNEDGLPLHCAPGGKADIIFHNNDGSFLIEPTMITSKAQQLNSETANVVRHMKDEEKRYNVPYRTMMVAPLIHSDVADFFQYEVRWNNAKITSLTIDKAIGLFDESETIKKLGLNFDTIVHLLRTNATDKYTDTINSYRFDLENILSKEDAYSMQSTESRCVAEPTNS